MFFLFSCEIIHWHLILISKILPFHVVDAVVYKMSNRMTLHPINTGNSKTLVLHDFALRYNEEVVEFAQDSRFKFLIVMESGFDGSGVPLKAYMPLTFPVLTSLSMDGCKFSRELLTCCDFPAVETFELIPHVSLKGSRTVFYLALTKFTALKNVTVPWHLLLETEEVIRQEYEGIQFKPAIEKQWKWRGGRRIMQRVSEVEEMNAGDEDDLYSYTEYDGFSSWCPSEASSNEASDDDSI